MIRPIVAMLVSLALPVGSAFAQIPEPESITISILEIDDTLFPEIRALVTVEYLYPPAILTLYDDGLPGPACGKSYCVIFCG